MIESGVSLWSIQVTARQIWLRAQEPDVTLDLHERTPGGLGVIIVRNMMDYVAYTFQNGRNILTMTLESE